MRIALSVAGSDPTGGAGLQLDLQVFRALGVHGAGVVTALTIQDTKRVHRVLPAFPSVVTDQLRALLADMAPHAVKLGMLATDDVLRAVSLGLGAQDEPRPPLVIDPVLRASDGTPLLERRAQGALVELMRGAALVTPNLPEAEALSGLDREGRARGRRRGRLPRAPRRRRGRDRVARRRADRGRTRPRHRLRALGGDHRRARPRRRARGGGDARPRVRARCDRARRGGGRRTAARVLGGRPRRAARGIAKLRVQPA
jgi:hypothetical protein